VTIQKVRGLSPLERVLRRTAAAQGGCIVFTGAKFHGYGKVTITEDGSARSVAAHRVVFEAAHGPIPNDRVVDHLCRNRSCVNITHLEAVSNAENILRGESLPARNARKSSCDRGHAFDTENTYITREGYRRCRTCSRWHDSNRRGR
jgi:hypothetical protein